jgi:hypothetical protein
MSSKNTTENKAINLNNTDEIILFLNKHNEEFIDNYIKNNKINLDTLKKKIEDLSVETKNEIDEIITVIFEKRQKQEELNEKLNNTFEQYKKLNNISKNNDVSNLTIDDVKKSKEKSTKITSKKKTVEEKQEDVEEKQEDIKDTTETVEEKPKKKSTKKTKPKEDINNEVVEENKEEEKPKKKTVRKTKKKEETDNNEEIKEEKTKKKTTKKKDN